MSWIAKNEDLKAKKKKKKETQKNSINKKQQIYCYLQFLVPVKTNAFT